MPAIHSVAVFCGASAGDRPVYREAATALGHGLATGGYRLIYGGGRVGLMGAVADAAIAAGGPVTGIIPEFLTRAEVAHPDVADLRVTDSMHSRKRAMFEAADAFVTIAGGLGTLDETFEILTWRQLRLHDKPIFVVDVAGSAAPLLALLDSVIATGFARPDIRTLYEPLPNVAALLARLAAVSAAADARVARL